MATINPNLTISLSGKGNVTEYIKTYIFNISTKLEKIYSLTVSDPAEVVDISDIQNLKYMIFQSDNNFELTFTTATESLKFITNLFILSPDNTFTSSLISITIKALSNPLPQKIEVRLYGVVV